MLYTLMNKNTPVAEISLNLLGFIEQVNVVHNISYAPVGVVSLHDMDKSELDVNKLNRWWKSRAIPASRKGITDVLDKLDIPTPQALMQHSLGLSLSDQFWIRPDNTVTWDKVNFFTNTFSEDVGKSLFGEHQLTDFSPNLMSADNSSDGEKDKRWTIQNGKRILIKKGSNPFQQEPYNEVVAYKIAETLHINHVKYDVSHTNKYAYCACENFITPNTELVTAFQLNNLEPQLNHENSYQHLMSMGAKVDAPNMEEYINKMLIFDYLIMNEDRHFRNFGVIRDVNTLKIIAPAPIFDSGNSLWYQLDDVFIGKDEDAKPFNIDIEKQIKLVTDWNCVDFSNVRNIPDIAREILITDPFTKIQRIDKICLGLEKRIKKLAKEQEHPKQNLVSQIKSNNNTEMER